MLQYLIYIHFYCTLRTISKFVEFNLIMLQKPEKPQQVSLSESRFLQEEKLLKCRLSRQTKDKETKGAYLPLKRAIRTEDDKRRNSSQAITKLNNKRAAVWPLTRRDLSPSLSSISREISRPSKQALISLGAKGKFSRKICAFQRKYAPFLSRRILLFEHVKVKVAG